MALSILNRLNEKTIRNNETSCWLYIGGNDGRYGTIRFNGKKTKVHRVSAHLFHGLDLNSRTLRALHKPICPNKNCWNPEHIYVGTDKDNVQDTIKSSKWTNRKVGSQKYWRKSR